MDGSGWNIWVYIGACLAVPAAWGALSAWLFGRLDRRGAADEAEQRRPPVDYAI